MAQGRRRLIWSGPPEERLNGRLYVIENVEGAPLLDPIRLCGSAFGLGVRRHRLFESSVLIFGYDACHHREQGRPVGVYHRMGDQVKGVDHTTGLIVYDGRTAGSVEEAGIAMGIDWMTWKELTQAIPPDYTEWIGTQLMRSLGRWHELDV